MGAHKSATDGTIRQRESRQVIQDLLRARKIPQSIYRFGKTSLEILDGTEKVKLEVKRGMSYYGLQSVIERVNKIADDIHRHKEQKGQLDIVDLVRQAEKTA